MLNHGSIQLVFTTKFKTNVYDETINVHPLIRKCPNFDYDGDQLFALIIKEVDQVKNLYIVHPRETIFNQNHPSVGDNVSLTSQAITLLNSWLEDV